MRTLPSTWSLLKRYGAVLYKGQNRMGLNSNPNLIAVLTGEREAEFEDGSEEPETKLINTEYREHGYITFQMEDGATWPNWPGVKFKNPPADIYYFPFFQAIDQARDMRCGAVGGRDYFQYLQEKKLHKYQFDVLYDFLEKYKTAPTFAFLHLQEYTHNDQNLARLYDDDLSSLLGTILIINSKSDQIWIV